MLRIATFLGLCMLSLSVAAFLSGWGPSPILEMYVPYRGGASIGGELLVLAILYSPVLYLIGLIAVRIGQMRSRQS